jgi:TP901 family phage tail tape measure protein
MKAFGIEVDDVKREILDNINIIGNTAATSNEEIVDMLTRSSAAMAAANNTLEQTIALESASVEITRNAESTGTAFKTLAMRIRGYDEETEQLSEDLENISGDIADLTKTAKTPGGISLFTDSSKQTYKSTYQILKEISEIYDDLSDKNQANNNCLYVQKCA